MVQRLTGYNAGTSLEATSQRSGERDKFGKLSSAPSASSAPRGPFPLPAITPPNPKIPDWFEGSPEQREQEEALRPFLNTGPPESSDGESAVGTEDAP